VEAVGQLAMGMAGERNANLVDIILHLRICWEMRGLSQIGRRNLIADLDFLFVRESS
jgi:hypothetical protein